MGPSGRFTHGLLYWIVGTCYIQVMYMGRAPRTKETLPDFRERSGHLTSMSVSAG